MDRPSNKKLIIGIVIVAVVASSGIIAGIIIFQPRATLDSTIISLMVGSNVPSLSVGIVINDTLVWSQGYGVQPDGIDTVYMIGSVSKIFAATAVMQLNESGSLALDADIDTYLPFSVRHPSYPGTPITLRMLLSHTSGISGFDIPLWDMDAEFIAWCNANLGGSLTPFDPRPTLGEFLNGTLNPAGPYYEPGVWANYQPGAQWQYTNVGFLLVSYLVEQIASQPYAEYVQENVIDPLNMMSTGFNYTDFTGRNALPYEQNDSQLIEGILYNWYNLGGGGLRSTVPDLAKLLLAHMNQGSYDGTQILLPQTVMDMQTSQIALSGTELGGFTYVGYGLGWPLYTEQTIGHGGAVPGYLAQIAFKTVSNGKYGIVYMLNKGSSFVHDANLLDVFLPALIDVLFDEAARLFTQ